MEIAIIAHDGKKADMVQFLNEHRALLQQKKITLVSTGTTGEKAKKPDLKFNVYFLDR
jgi:methylglyoxal synthase